MDWKQQRKAGTGRPGTSSFKSVSQKVFFFTNENVKQNLLCARNTYLNDIKMSYKELVWELTGCLCRALVGQTLQVPKTETRKLNQEKYGTYVFLLTCKAMF